MGPTLLKMLREAVIGAHERAKAQAAFPFADRLPLDLRFSPLTAMLGLFAKFAEAEGAFNPNLFAEVDEIVVELGLYGDDRQETLNLFHAAIESGLTFSEILIVCRDFTVDHFWLRAVLISLLFRIAHADEPPSALAVPRLQQACAALGRDYEQSLASFNEESAQRAFEKRWIAEKMDSAYGVLGCDGGEPLDAVKRRFRTLAKTLHPDIVALAGGPEIDLQTTSARFQEVQEAYQFVLVQRGR